MLCRSVQTYIHLHGRRNRASQSRKKSQLSEVTAVRSQKCTLCFLFWLTVPQTTDTVAASGTSHSMLLSATTAETRAPWDTIPMTWRPFRSCPENTSPATPSCYNRKQFVWILTANLMPQLSPCYTSNIIVHITVFCAQYEAQCVCTVLPSHNTDTKIPGDQYKTLGIHWRLILERIFKINA